LSSHKEHITPNLDEWPITRFYEKRGDFIKALNEYTFKRLSDKNSDIVSVLEKTIYMEKQRVKNKPWKVDPPDDKDYWSSLGKELASAQSPEEKIRKSSTKELKFRVALKKYVRYLKKEQSFLYLITLVILILFY